MPCDGRSDGNRGRFGVTCFADHDDVRILAEQGAEADFKGKAGGRMHLHLIEPRQVLLDRVFDGGNVDRQVGKLFERHIKRRGFSGAGRTRHVNDAVRGFQHPFELLIVFLIHAERARIVDAGVI